MQWSVSKGMVDYINQRDKQALQPLLEELAYRHHINRDWDWLEDNPRLFKRMLFENLLLKRMQENEPQDDDDLEDEDRLNKPPHHPVKKADLIVLDEQKDEIARFNVHAKDRSLIPIKYEENLIGWLSIPHHKNITAGFELVFVEQQKKTFFVVSLIVLALSAFFALPLARHFIVPIKEIASGANKLTHGQYQLHIDTQRGDELGELARDFNELAMTLSKNENARRRWVADISHELRTPLAVLRGEIEAMLDGVRPMSPTGLASMHDEIKHLSQLVNDLYELSKADIGDLSYRKQDVDFTKLIAHKLNAYQEKFTEKSLSLSLKLPDSSVHMWADETRLNQLLDNLLTNSVRYTDVGGSLLITLSETIFEVILKIEDSAPTVSDEALTKIFDYLYRTEQSRNREHGGTGLGLAICKRIVEGHNGTISAAHSSLGGIEMTLIFTKQQVGHV